MVWCVVCGVYSSLAKKKMIASAADIKKQARIFISGTQTTKCMKKQSESVSAFQPSIIFPAPQASLIEGQKPQMRSKTRLEPWAVWGHMGSANLSSTLARYPFDKTVVGSASPHV